MESVKPINCLLAQPSDLASDKESLVSLTAKVLAGGGLASDCMALFSENNAFRSEARIEAVRIKEQTIRQLRRRRMTLLKKRMRAMRKARSLSSFGDTFGGVMNIFAAVARVFCPPAGVAMKLVGGLVSSQCTIAAASCSRIAETAVADAFKTDHRQETAEEGRDEILESLRNAVEAETRMLNRISSLADSEQTRVVLR